MVGQNHYNSPNPLNFDYPKVDHLRGSRYATQGYSSAGTQYMSYPKFKQLNTERKVNTQETDKKNIESEAQQKLSRELEKEIEELKELTKTAKALALKKKQAASNNLKQKQPSFIEISGHNKIDDYKKQKNYSNLDNV